MATVHLDGPVGRRWNQVNVRNAQQDQKQLIDLFSRIPESNGGKKEAWPVPILAGASGDCSPYLLSAIWDFQKHWQARGVFKNIDGVVDPRGHTLFRLNLLAGGGCSPPASQPHIPQPIIHHRRVPGTFQVTNVWSATLGEVGLGGGCKVEITQPDGKKFVVSGLGAGIGYSIDPATWLKGMKEGVKALNPFGGDKFAIKQLFESLDNGILFNLGDWFQLFGGSLSSLTSGVLIPNPINKYVGQPTAVSRYLITEAGKANFAIGSVGGGTGFGGECGLLGFGGPTVGAMFLCPVLGWYGSIGATAKFGVGAQVMVYGTTAVTDLP